MLLATALWPPARPRPAPVLELGLVEAVADDPLAVLLLGGLGCEPLDDLVHCGYRGRGAVDRVAPEAPSYAVLVAVDEAGEGGLPPEVYDLRPAPGQALDVVRAPDLEEPAVFYGCSLGYRLSWIYGDDLPVQKD
jgi:hypothetical protein